MKRVLRSIYRMRSIMLAAVVVILIGFALFGPLLPEAVDPLRGVVAPVALGVLVFGVLVSLIGPSFLSDQTPVTVTAPVRGRWLALNSPASKIPSHGVRAYGQTYAIDLVYEPIDQQRPQFGDGPGMRRASEYPAFGEPVYAMFGGTVQRASGWRRDHKSRAHMLAVVYMMVEGAIRELGGPGFILGNHVVLRGDNGVYAVLAHLQQGSLQVQNGDTVMAGQLIGRCGNSGNSSEPHVHAQLMDRASTLTAIGMPMAFASITLDNQPEVLDTLPRNGQIMTAERGSN